MGNDQGVKRGKRDRWEEDRCKEGGEKNDRGGCGEEGGKGR